MFAFGLIAIIGIAQAEPPKKKTEKTEKSSQTTKSDKSKTSKKSPSNSTSKKSTGSAKTNANKSVKSGQKTATQKAPSAPPKSTPAKDTRSATQKVPQPAGKSTVDRNPAQQQVGQEQSQATAHQPMGNPQSNGPRPTYERAPNNIARPSVGKEQDNTPTAHQPIGNGGGYRTPTYERAPDNIERPSVGKEQNNTPTAHEPIGGHSTRPEKGRPTREPEGRIDREPPKGNPPTRPEKSRPTRDAEQPGNGKVERQPPSNSQRDLPQKTRPSKSEERETPPSRKVERVEPTREGAIEQPAQSVSPGKSQYRNPYNGGFNTSTREQNTNTTSSGGQSVGDWGLGLGTLSFASDYVDGGAYNDGGMGMSLGFRVVPQFEIEASYGQYTDSTLESSRNRLNRPVQVVGQVHPFPKAFVSPFVTGGYVWNNIAIDDEYIADGENKTAQQEGWLTGLALGAGVTFNVHQNIALELDGRLFQYNNLGQWDDAGDTATLVSMGVVLGF